ncbi:4-hydroxy-tetrahydrodipicolinate synthase [Oceanobacillus jeddahense]|uniref:4-hydroxy-tetrahydrodipicolinate synthase n=1 Tax=Oceanobacillus jeddahense TaxID=1462527 RepID=UPI000595EE4F|nr:4-hydroxy-tetrahydrodipicolinate synthase [Oceanobacillus jeddahense]
MFSGVIPAMVTPLNHKQQVNEAVIPALVDNLIAAGVDGLFILGTNGEFHLLSQDEKVNVTKKVVSEVNQRVPVIVGVGGNSTKEVIELSKEVESVGADALSVITPFFVIPDQDEMIDHYRSIAQNTNLPVMLYNIPSKTGVNLDKKVVTELAKVKNIVGIKDSSGDLENIKGYIEASKNEEFHVICGTDSLILDALEAGATGAVAATANVVPKIVNAIYENWKNGKINEASEQQNRLSELRESFQYGTLPSVLKKLVELSGAPVGPPRLPVKEVSSEVENKLKKIVASYK